jgi:twitching motility protein PilT
VYTAIFPAVPGYAAMTPADTKRLAYSVLTDAQKHRFEENLELDFSFGLKGMSRFVPIFSIRRVPSARCFVLSRTK